MKRIHPGAYQALREALSVVFWYKRNFKNYLHMALRDHPELLAGLNFDDYKRWAALTFRTSSTSCSPSSIWNHD